MEGKSSSYEMASGQLFEVERILDRMINDDGTYLYHVKWLGCPISNDPLNFVNEEDMKCPELLRRFDSYERAKRKRRSKKNQRGNKRKRQGKSVERKQVASSRIPRVENNDVLGQTEAGYVDQRQERNHSPSNDEGDDPWGLFKYVSKESDGFKRGYKFVEISEVIEHPVTGRALGIVVFEHPRDGNQLAQYIPLRELHDNAPMELYEYFCHVKGENQFGIALKLISRNTLKSVSRKTLKLVSKEIVELVSRETLKI